MNLSTNRYTISGPDLVVIRGIFPGSFNPLHKGHLAMARAAEDQLNGTVAFELSLGNVDKPSISMDDAAARSGQFGPHATVIVTSGASMFEEKCSLFPGTPFVVGVDTAERILMAKYYSSPEGLLDGLRHYRKKGATFLVADRNGKTVADVLASSPHPEFNDLFVRLEGFEGVAISSTEIRSTQ